MRSTGWVGTHYFILHQSRQKEAETLLNLFFFFNFLFLHLFIFERQSETEHKQGTGRERRRHRIWSRLQAPSYQHRAWRGARTHKPSDHDLSPSRMHNHWATQAPPLLNLTTDDCISNNLILQVTTKAPLSHSLCALKQTNGCLLFVFIKSK